MLQLLFLLDDQWSACVSSERSLHSRLFQNLGFKSLHACM